VKAGRIEHFALQVREAGGQISGRNPAQCGMQAKPVHHINEVRGKANAYRHIADGVF
jgi:hypothetical protein